METFKFVIETILAIGTVVVSIIAIVLSRKSDKNLYQLTERLSKKEHEMSENLKYELIEIIGVIRTIDAKAAICPNIKAQIDYTNDIAMLNKLQSSPGYELYLYTIKSESDRRDFELFMRSLSDALLKSGFSSDTIRYWCHKIIDLIEKHTNVEDCINMKFGELLKKLCSMESTFTSFDKEAYEKSSREEEKIYKAFMEELLDNNKNLLESNGDYYNVLLLYSSVTDNTDNLKLALKNGAKRNISIGDIIKNYEHVFKNVLDEYCKNNNLTPKYELLS